MTDADHSWSRKPAFKRCPVKMKWLPGNYALKANQDLWASNKEKMLAKYGKAGSGGLIHGPAYESADVPDHAYPDGYSTRLAIATLKDHREKKPNQPLFLALGFKKPHLDYVAPKKNRDLYDRDKIQLTNSGPKRSGRRVIFGCVRVMAFPERAHWPGIGKTLCMVIMPASATPMLRSA